MFQVRKRVRPQSYLLIYAIAVAALFVLHGPLLSLPYYGDEAGQFIPSAIDLYRTGAWIPHSATPNIHPPGVMAWLALVWHIAGLSITVARVGMMLIAGFGVLTTFLLAIELSRGSPGTPAFAAVAMLTISPLFFSQAIMAQLDMPAMAFTSLALLLFLQNRFRAAALACVVLVLVKETGAVVPMVLGGWILAERRGRGSSWQDAGWFAAPLVVLAAWLVALHHATGHWTGNSEFAEYNVFFPLNPVRFGFALLRRAYYLLIGSGHFIGTAALIYAWRRMPLLRDRPWRIATLLFLAHVVAVTALGGAVLERYLLPVLPILYSAFAVSLRALEVKTRFTAMGAIGACLAAANIFNPLYPFPFENNLMWVDFVDVQRTAAFAVDRYPGETVTTFPMSAVLQHPEYGYLILPHKVREVPDFRPATIAGLEGHVPDTMLVYDTELDPLRVRSSRAFQWFFGRFYRYERPMSAHEIADKLGMAVTRQWTNHGFTMYLLVSAAADKPYYLR